jgi:predicted SAM-dependent methyltransferase
MRREKILAGLGDLGDLLGVEIGALDKPLLSRTDGKVLYVDYTDTATLREKYADFPDHDVSKIVEVDAVWGDNTLQQGIGEDVKADFLVASHVIEHVPDLITWLNEIEEILVPGGTVHLAVPDRRFTFDIRRQDSRLTDVVYAYVVRARRPLPHVAMDFSLHFQAIEIAEAWDHPEARDRPIEREQLDHAVAIARELLRSDAYLDVHCWVFTPLSFARLMEQLCALELVNFVCRDWTDTDHNDLEFCVVLAKGQSASENAASWRRMAKGIASAKMDVIRKGGALDGLKITLAE